MKGRGRGRVVGGGDLVWDFRRARRRVVVGVVRDGGDGGVAWLVLGELFSFSGLGLVVAICGFADEFTG